MADNIKQMENIKLDTFKKIGHFQVLLYDLCEEYYIFDAVIVAIMQMSQYDLVMNIIIQSNKGEVDTIKARIIDCIKYYKITSEHAKPLVDAFNDAIRDINSNIVIKMDELYPKK